MEGGLSGSWEPIRACWNDVSDESLPLVDKVQLVAGIAAAIKEVFVR